MANCSRSMVSCQMEFRLTVEQKQKAISRAEELGADQSPYGIPIYPFVWSYTSQTQSIRLEMGEDTAGKKAAMFTFEDDSHRPSLRTAWARHGQFLPTTVVVHISVFIIKNDLAPDWSAEPIDDTRIHWDALNHFKGTLLGLPGIYRPRIGQEAERPVRNWRGPPAPWPCRPVPPMPSSRQRRQRRERTEGLNTSKVIG